MSYSILYRAMFVKMKDDSFIPMIECGDNNVYDPCGRRRSRDWDMIRWGFETDEQKRRYAKSEKEILDLAQKEIDLRIDQYVGKELSYTSKIYTRNDVLSDFGNFSCLQVSGHRVTTASQFLSFFKSGFRNAVTFDDLNRFGCTVRLSWWKDNGHEEDFASTEEELAEKWEKCQSMGITPYVGLGYSAEQVWREMKGRTHRERAIRRSTEGSFIVSFLYFGSLKYLARISSRAISFTDSSLYARKYSSKKNAESAIEKIVRRCNKITNAKVECLSAA